MNDFLDHEDIPMPSDETCRKIAETIYKWAKTQDVLRMIVRHKITDDRYQVLYCDENAMTKVL